MTRNNSPTYSTHRKASAACRFPLATFRVSLSVFRFLLPACRLALVFLLLAVLAGCVPTIKEAGEPEVDFGTAQDAVNTARLNFFLNLKEPDSPEVQFELTNLEVLAGETWLPVSKGPLLLDSEKIAARQVFLGARPVMPGRYARLRFTVEKSFFRQGGKYTSVPVDPYTVELALSSPVALDKGDSQSLFVIWDVRKSLEGPKGVYPVMAMVQASRQLFDNLVYVACPDIGTIFVVRCDKDWVADSFGITGRPTYLAMDPNSADRRLYVLAAGESRIKIVELNSQRIVDSYSIPLAVQPSLMVVSPDGKSLYILDKGNSYLSLLDLESGRLITQVRMGFEPQYMTFLANKNVLAVSSVLSQTVTLHNPLTLQEVGSIATGIAPDGLLLANNLLYIAENGSDAVSVFNFDNNLMQNQINVGFGPRRLLDVGGVIYVSNYDDGSLSVIYPGQFIVGRQIRGLGRPLEMISDQTYRRLYVGDEQEKGLAVIDSNINQLIRYIKFGARPLGLAIIQ